MVHFRRETIKDIIHSDGVVTVKDLVQRFNVSIETIRRDLEYLEKHNCLQRIYGGAIALHPYEEEPNYRWRQEHNAQEKSCIAALAANLIEDSETVILTHGTTVLEVARHLNKKRNLTVITPSLPIAAEVVGYPGTYVYCLGGHLRADDLCTSGMLAEQSLHFLNADKLVLGVGGITADHGITDYNVDESTLLRKLLEISKTVIVVADHSKFGKIATCNICGSKDISYLITDSGTPKEAYAPFIAMGIQVLVSDSILKN
ncbi:MAG: DeoR/GlpR family DNA-binding transcription regulator [Christensenellaceae bacterium]|jgi:DeoR/GlpR family transcriptional regulator of sugar metabolism|nr:DeoR/GlpR family DNA-binding transcription regulator [Christensenellaceae bacterium]